jgi:hypothetical protein
MLIHCYVPCEAAVMAIENSAVRRFVPVIPRLVFSVVTAAGLAVDAVVHLRLAGDRDAIGGALSEGNLFRIEAAAALLAALIVLALPRRRAAYAVALLVAASALGAVVLYRYVNVGAIGPLPNMYEPIWYGEKTVSAIAELVAGVSAAGGLGLACWRGNV